MTLPSSSPDQAVSGTADRLSEDAALAGARVLIADASSRTRQMLREIVVFLQALDVLETDDAERALAIVQEAPVQLILCGVKLVGDRNGAQLLEELRERQLLSPTTMVVMFGTERSAREIASVAELGPDGYLVKPFRRADMISRLERFSLRKRLLGRLLDTLEIDGPVAAIQYCRTLADEQPWLRSEAYRSLCERLFALERIDLADVALQEVLAYGQLPWALAAMARIHCHEGRLSEAQQVLEDAIHRWPKYLSAYELLADLLKQAGNYDRALDVLERADTISSFSLKRMRMNGEIALRNGDLPRAHAAFSRIVERVRQAGYGDGDYASLIQVMVARGHFDAAEHLLQEQERRLGDNVDVRVTRVLVELARAQQESDFPAIDAAMESLDVYVSQATDAVSPILLQALDACVTHAQHELGYRIAQRLAQSSRVDRDMLHHARRLVERLRRRPRDAPPPDDDGLYGTQAVPGLN